MLLTWAPQVLRAAGLQVVETGGWTNRSHGPYPDSISGVWHHDASPPGDSPGALNWMISNWNSASANFWVNRQGVWYCVGAGVSWHAGVVVGGMPGSFVSFGVETDQTINEQPTEALLDSVRRGFAALLKHMGRSSSSLYFHKTVAPLRKQDPWLGPSSANRGNWPNELIIERSNVQRIMDGGSPSKPTEPPTPKPPEEDDMPRRIVTVYDGNMKPLGLAFDGPTGVVGLQNDHEVNCVQAVIDNDTMVNQVEIDAYNAVLRRGVGAVN